MKRLVNAGASFMKVWSALDFDEIKDAGRGFLFQLMAVLCTGHNETLVGSLISRWCLFLNLGSLFLDTNSKLRYPISKLILWCQKQTKEGKLNAPKWLLRPFE